MTRIRIPMALALALLLSLTALAAGMARGAMAADGVLCGYGSVRIVLSDDGLPLFTPDGAPVTVEDGACPDCVLGAIALAPERGETDFRAALTRLIVTQDLHSLRPALWRLGGQGRSPPRAA